LHTGKLPDITPANLHEWVQVHSIEPKIIDPTPTIGLMRGMYFSNGPVSGGSMDLNVLLVPKQATAAEPAGLYLGNITGNMKDVMRESVVQAFNFLQSHTKELGISDEMLKQHVILNVNTPTLEMPNDGPSAGSALVLAMTSALLGRPIRGDLAMTGTFGIQGNDFKGQVGQIGGVAEKITGSYNEGVRKFLVPQANIRDLNELSDWMKDAIKAGQVEIIPVTNIVQALNYTLGVGPKAKLELWQPSQSATAK
jgi:ATP-dependent Lon protease